MNQKDFDAAQAAYDAQLPPSYEDEEIEIEVTE